MVTINIGDSFENMDWLRSFPGYKDEATLHDALAKKFALTKKFKKKAEEGELDEAVALAVQNYRDGLVDADDLVAFLAPARLEKGGPGSGWFAPPRGTHTARMTGKTAAQVRGELKRDSKRKYSRMADLKKKSKGLSDQMPDSYPAYEAWQAAKREGRADAKELEAEYFQQLEAQNKLMDKIGKVESEYWQVRNSIREGALEKLKVDNPADFETDMGKLRKGRKDLQQGSDAFASLMGRGTLDGQTVTMHTTLGDRGYYDKDGVYLPSHNRRSKVVVHEQGHWLEDRDPDVHTKALAFLEERTKGEQAISLRKATGNPGYRANEMTKKDKFMHPYSGKQYDWGYATEIVSMGLEHMYSEPIEFATKDPEHFDFIYNLMRGK